MSASHLVARDPPFKERGSRKCQKKGSCDKLHHAFMRQRRKWTGRPWINPDFCEDLCLISFLRKFENGHVHLPQTSRLLSLVGGKVLRRFFICRIASLLNAKNVTDLPG